MKRQSSCCDKEHQCFQKCVAARLCSYCLPWYQWSRLQSLQRTKRKESEVWPRALPGETDAETGTSRSVTRTGTGVEKRLMLGIQGFLHNCLNSTLALVKLLRI